MSDDDGKRARTPLPEAFSARAITPLKTTVPPARSAADAPTVCERCSAAMYRMHAVWRCPSCGFKTDCCGW